MNLLKEFWKDLQKPHELPNYKKNSPRKGCTELSEIQTTEKWSSFLGKSGSTKTLYKEDARAKKLTVTAKTLEPSSETFKWDDTISWSQLKSR